MKLLPLLALVLWIPLESRADVCLRAPSGTTCYTCDTDGDPEYYCACSYWRCRKTKLLQWNAPAHQKVSGTFGSDGAANPEAN